MLLRALAVLLGDSPGVEIDFIVQPVQGGLHIRHPGGQLFPLAHQKIPAGLQGAVPLLGQGGVL